MRRLPARMRHIEQMRNDILSGPCCFICLEENKAQRASRLLTTDPKRGIRRPVCFWHGSQFAKANCEVTPLRGEWWKSDREKKTAPRR